MPRFVVRGSRFGFDRIANGEARSALGVSFEFKNNGQATKGVR
jgi:hypothetical protein